MLRARLTVLPTREESFRLRFHFCSKPVAVCLRDKAVGSTQLDNRIPPFPRRLARSYCMANATVKKLHTSKPSLGTQTTALHTEHTSRRIPIPNPAVHSPTLHPLAEWAWANFCAELACTCMSQLLVGHYPVSTES